MDGDDTVSRWPYDPILLLRPASKETKIPTAYHLHPVYSCYLNVPKQVKA
jgi:hypothetical protein